MFFSHHSRVKAIIHIFTFPHTIKCTCDIISLFFCRRRRRRPHKKVSRGKDFSDWCVFDGPRTKTRWSSSSRRWRRRRLGRCSRLLPKSGSSNDDDDGIIKSTAIPSRPSRGPGRPERACPSRSETSTRRTRTIRRSHPFPST